jgi:radial spoke head protein 4A
MFFIYI